MTVQSALKGDDRRYTTEAKEAMERADKVDVMTTPEKIGEPSMEEILASIRKIIAEEPQSSGSGPDRRAVNPLLAGMDRRADSAEAPLPFSDRPPPSLDRLSSALKPDPVPPRETAAAASASSSLDDDLADILDEPPGVLPPSPFGIKRPTPPAETSDAAPPEKPAELVPATPAPAAPSSAGSSSAGSSSASISTSSAPVEAPSPTPAEMPGTLAPIVEASPAPVVTPPAVTPPVVTPPVSSMPPLRRAAFYPPQRKPDPPAAQRPSLPPVSPASELPDADAGLAWKSSSSPTPAAMNGRAASAASTPASSALDNLAVGLAAAAIAESAKPAPAAAAVSPAPQQAAPVRSLEDAVTDLLKPMLQQWLADNMPRIIERALRVEAANGASPGDKGPTQR